MNVMKRLKWKNCIIILLSSAFLAFGLYQVHAMAGVTEGGVLGMTLLLQHWFDLSPAISSAVMNAICYFIGWKLLGSEFILYSFIAASGFSVSYRFFEQFDPLWPQLYEMPLAAAIAGAIFVGVGTGICVRMGSATCGDDALAMSIAHVTKKEIQWVYLFSDLTVLGLSVTYIPIRRLGYSLLTVLLSGQIIGWIQKTGERNHADGRKTMG